jgi:transcriptional regulator with XRE-family HTH domain
MKSMQRKSKQSSVGSVRPTLTGRQTSRSSLPTSSPEDDEAALLSLVGGQVTQDPQIDPSDLEVAVAVGRVRGQILAAAKKEGIGVREMARRLKISASAVSRQLRSEGDMRFSTAILFARALGRRWRFSLSPSDAASVTDDEGRTPSPTLPKPVPWPQFACNNKRRSTILPDRSNFNSEGSDCSDTARRQSRLLVSRDRRYSRG